MLKNLKKNLIKFSQNYFIYKRRRKMNEFMNLLTYKFFLQILFFQCYILINK